MLSFILAMVMVFSLIPSTILTNALAADVPSSISVDWNNFEVLNNGNPFYSEALESSVYIRDIPVAVSDGTTSYAFCYAHGLDLKNRGDNTWNYVSQANVTAAAPFLSFYYNGMQNAGWDTWTSSSAASWVNVAVWMEQAGLLTDYNDEAQLLLLAKERETVLQLFGYGGDVNDSLVLLKQIVSAYKAGSYGTWIFNLYNHSSDDSLQPLLVGRIGETEYQCYIKISKTAENGAYYLSGATFGVYSDANCTTELDRFSTTESQWSISNKITLKSSTATLYVKEISTGNSDLLKDTSVYSVTVSASTNNTAATAAAVAQVIDNPTTPPPPDSGSVIQKIDALTGGGIGGATFKLEGDASEGGYISKSVTTLSDGTIELQWLDSTADNYIKPGYYMVTEEVAPQGYEKTDEAQYIKLWLEWIKDDSYESGGYYVPLHSGALVFTNYQKSNIIFTKLDGNNKPLAGATIDIYHNNSLIHSGMQTGTNGTITLSEVSSGVYTFIETAAPSGYVMSTYGNSKSVYIDAADTSTTTYYVSMVNYAYPDIVIEKYSTSNKPLAGGVFEVTIDGTTLGTFKTSSAGTITISYEQYGEFLNPANDSWTVRCEEIEAPEGYFIAEQSWQENEIKKGQTLSTFVFVNEAYPSIEIEKRSVSGELLANATFEVVIDNRTLGTFTTDANGSITIDYATYSKYLNENNDSWTIRVTEVEAPEGYFIAEQSWQENQLYKGQSLSTFVFVNEAYPSIVIEKRSMSGELLPNAKFEVVIDNRTLGSFTTDKNGKITIDYATYSKYLNESNDSWTIRVTEQEAPEGYLLSSPNWQENQLLKGQALSTFVFYNESKPNLEIIKYGTTADGDNILLPNVTYRIWQQGNEAAYQDVTTDTNGRIYLEGLDTGYWCLQELSTGGTIYEVDSTVYTIELVAGETAQHIAVNHRRPNLTIKKICSITCNSLPNTKLQIFSYDADGAETDLGIFYTDENGELRLESLDPTRIKVVELEPTNGYGIPDGEGTKEFYLKLDEDKTVYMKNVPLSAIVIRKTDTETPSNPLAGAVFELRYLGGDTSGTGGTTIGQYTTSESGSVVITGLQRGYYIIEERIPPAGYSLSSETTQTVFISGNDQDIITVTFRNQSNPGFLLLKRDASDKATPLPGAVYKITDSSGSVIGDNNGLHTTGEDGTIYIANLTPGITLLVQEVEAPAGYVLDNQVYTAKLDSSGAYSLLLYNEPMTSFTLIKLDASDKTTPLQGVEYYITYANGTPAPGGSNGYFTTDENGKITITGLTEGDILKIQETKTKNESYILDGTVYTYTIEAEGNTKTFYNESKGGFLLIKRDSESNALLSGVQYKITYANGTVVGNSNGLYTTDKNGEIRIVQSFEPGTVLNVVEVKAKSGYLLDDTVHTIQITEADKLYTITAYNTPVGGVEIIKLDASDRKTRIANIEFEIRVAANGAYVGTYETDKNGKISVDLEPGVYQLIETNTGKTGYILDATPITFEVKEGETTTLKVYNEKASRILLYKYDSVTNQGIAGAKFLLMDSKQNPLLIITTDQDGYAYIDASDELTEGKYYLKELENDGYVLDTQIKTVYLESGSTTTIEWANTPILGQIQIIKKSADDNPINGLPAGSLLADAVFEIYDKAGNKVDTIVTDANGRAVSKLLPLDRYTIREVQAPNYYSINDTVMTAYLEHEGQIVTFEVLNKSVNTGVNIKKTGYSEVMSNQPIKYTFTGIANTSSVALQSFYWRDTLPSEVQLTQVVTGTYNQALSYKIVYKINTSDSYYTLADNLSTSKNYVLDASATALGLAANERVTEVMFVFGTVKAGFAQVETPYIYGQTINGLANGSSFVNVADVGGLYQVQWIMGVSRWVTTVYGTTKITLPKTGY